MGAIFCRTHFFFLYLSLDMRGQTTTAITMTGAQPQPHSKITHKVVGKAVCFIIL